MQGIRNNLKAAANCEDVEEITLIGKEILALCKLLDKELNKGD